jgi:WD40 repeat protein
MTSIHPKKTRVVLIGSSVYDDSTLPPILKIRDNIPDLARLFRDQAVIGVESDKVVEVLDPPERDDAIKAVIKAANEATDTLVVYYAGHGMIGAWTPSLYLAVKKTPRNAPDELGISSVSLLDIIRRSPALKRILILDCCFSGRIVTSFMGPKEEIGVRKFLANFVEKSFSLEGGYILAASGPHELATFLYDEKHTDFTGALINILEKGVPGGPEYFTTNFIYEHISSASRALPGMPNPVQLIINRGGDIVVALNRLSQRPIPSPVVTPPIANPDLAPSPAPTDAADRLAGLAEDDAATHKAENSTQSGFVRVLSRLSFPGRRWGPWWLRPAVWVALAIWHLVWALLRSPTFFSAVGGGVGVALALLQSRGWSLTALDPLRGSSWDHIGLTWWGIAFLLAGPAGNIWIGVLAGAFAGCRELPSNEFEQIQADLIRPHFWKMVRERDPLVWFVLKWSVWRMLVIVGGAVIILVGIMIGSLIGGDLIGPDLGVKLGVLLGAGLASRVPAWMNLVGPLFMAFPAFIVCLLVWIIAWLIGAEAPGGDTEHNVLILVWSMLMLLLVIGGSMEHYVREDDSEIAISFKWLTTEGIGWMWVMLRILVFAVAGGFWCIFFGSQVVRLDGHRDTVRGVAFDSQNRFALTASEDGNVRLWNLESGQGMWLSKPRTMPILCMAVSADGHFIAAGGGKLETDPETEKTKGVDCVIWVWTRVDSDPHELRWHTRPVLSLAISSTDPPTLISAAGDGVQLWDLTPEKLKLGRPSNKLFLKPEAGHTNTVVGLAFSPDGRRVASAGRDGTVRVRDLADTVGQKIRVFKGHKGAVNCVAYSPNGRQLASGGKDGTVRLWNIEKAEAKVFHGHSKPVRCVTFSSAGDRLVSGGDDGIVRVWVVATGQEVHRYGGPFFWSVWSVAVSSDGELVLSGDAQALVRLWRLPP